jgi:hypothetical protein
MIRGYPNPLAFCRGTLDQRSEDSVTAQSLKARVAKRLKATGQPKRRRRDRYSKPFRSKPKPEGYVFGRPTLYRPEYCQRAIDFITATDEKAPVKPVLHITGNRPEKSTNK